ncbi:hypothetical protein V6Z12_D05G009200 [Gossypium hirsutum]
MMEVPVQEQVRVFELSAELQDNRHIFPGQFVIQQLVYEAVFSTKQIFEETNVKSLTNSISKYLADNYSFGLETITEPDSPKVLIVVDVNQTWVFGKMGCQVYKRGWFDNGEAVVDEEGILMRLTCSLELRSGFLMMLVPVPGLGSFEACDRGGETLAADGSTCAICLEGLSNGTCVKTPCSHAFHGRCIARWVWRKKSCPMCRFELLLGGKCAICSCF